MKKQRENLYEILNSTEEEEIRIASLKDRFSPIDLVTQLESLSKLDLIKIIWEKKVIINKIKSEKLLAEKNNLKRDSPKTPSHMKAYQTEINKPYI